MTEQEINRRFSELMEAFRLCAVRIESLRKTLGPEALAVYEKQMADFEERWKEMESKKKQVATQELIRRILEEHEGPQQ